MKIIIDNTSSINETLKNLKSGDEIYLKKGIYNEKVTILNDNIKITGEDKDETIINNHDYFHKIMPDYNECNTFRTYTVYAGGKNITIKNLTIKNSSIPATKYGQAVALHADSDNLLCENVNLYGEQDTLFTGPIPYFLRERHKNFLDPIFMREYYAKQVYKNCDIYGNVDFIFGNATALFYKCNLHSLKQDTSTHICGYISAPSHEQNQEFGYLFLNCKLTHDEGVNNVYLARPWGKYGNVAFIDNEIDSHINKEGFSVWIGKNRHQTAKFMEYGNYDVKDRASWSIILNEKEKNDYVEAFLKHINYTLD